MILNTRFSQSEKMFTYLELGLVRIPSILYPDWLISKHTKSRQKMLCFDFFGDAKQKIFKSFLT